MDKAFWQQILERNGEVPDGMSINELTPELMRYLGLPDGELRDDIAYRLLTQWMIGGRYGAAELRGMMSAWLNNLTLGIGEQGTDSVFLRSFSALMLSVLVYRDNQESFLTSDEIHTLLDHGLVYLATEQDLRGYIEGKGWAHSAAHTADLLKFLARSPRLNADDHKRILDAIADKLLAPAVHFYNYDEDERLGLAALDVFKRGTLSPDDWARWLSRFTDWKAARPTDAPIDLSIFAPYHNSKQFLRAFYFQALPHAAHSQLPEQLAETLNHF